MQDVGLTRISSQLVSSSSRSSILMATYSYAQGLGYVIQQHPLVAMRSDAYLCKLTVRKVDGGEGSLADLGTQLILIWVSWVYSASYGGEGHDTHPFVQRRA